MINFLCFIAGVIVGAIVNWFLSLDSAKISEFSQEDEPMRKLEVKHEEAEEVAIKIKK